METWLLELIIDSIASRAAPNVTDSAASLVAAGEWGVAFEDLSMMLSELDVPLSLAELAKLELLGKYLEEVSPFEIRTEWLELRRLHAPSLDRFTDE